MDESLSYNIADARLSYEGRHEPHELTEEKVYTFNQRHQEVLGFYGLELEKGTVYVIDDRINGLSNLGVFRSKQLRQAMVLAAALPAAAVMLHGHGALNEVPTDHQTKDLVNRFKRANDRVAAQVMAEVLQITTQTLEPGEDVVIESAITEGVRVKPGVELGGNPTIPVGALFGKDEHCKMYGHSLGPEVTRLSMGSDVIDGTTKTVKGLHSSLTSFFITESHVKRHLPDIYVERWMAGAPFPEFNPRYTDVRQEAEIIAGAYNEREFSNLTSFFLDRPRHYEPMRQLNRMGIATPFDKDGDLFPTLIMGLPGLKFPDGRGLDSMIGEIGGSAEWAVGVLPLVWRGGHALGMLTSQSSLTRKDLSEKELWNERFHYTEEELMLIHDARFEQKPFFTVKDIMEDPYAGGVSAFTAISDNYFLPQLKGISIDREKGTITTHTLLINSMGVTEHWEMTFKARESVDAVAQKMASPKKELVETDKKKLEDIVKAMAADERQRFRLYHFFVNEYYPAIIQSGGQMVLLAKTVDAVIARGAMSEHDRDIVRAVVKAVPEWFAAEA